MKNALVRKFQAPQSGPLRVQVAHPQVATPQVPVQGTVPAADVEVPEINTNFIDNLFHDSTFLNRFDAAFDQTVPMELTAQPAEPASRGTSADANQPGPNLLELDLPMSARDGSK
jgi:hypothetical protein